MQWFKSISKPQVRDWLGRHLLFWLFYVVFFTIVTLPYNGDFFDCLRVALLWLPFHAFFTYLLLYGLLPWLIQMRYDWFWGGLIGYLLLCLGSNFLFRAFVLIPYQTGIRLPINNDTRNEIFAVGSFLGAQSIAGIAAGIKLVRYWYQKEQTTQQLARETLAVELQMLKAQVHPHFLFNTLNNLYSLTLKQSTKAPDIVLKLSGLLHYMLHECTGPTVPLAKEIAFLNNYIALEKLRYGNRLVVTTTVQGNIQHKAIAPLLLIPFLENAFKHGSSQQTGQARIDLRLQVQDHQLTFRLENSTDPFAIQTGQPISTRADHKKIGLTNVRNRLQLIYPDAHTLAIWPENEHFVVELTIRLAKDTPAKANSLFTHVTN